MSNYQVGMDVSRGFNEDYYPCGKISRITKKYLWTDTGHKFVKKTFTDVVLEETPNGLVDIESRVEYYQQVRSPFVLVFGIRSEWNLEF